MFDWMVCCQHKYSRICEFVLFLQQVNNQGQKQGIKLI